MNTFLRRDGENTAAGNINMDSHKLVNVSDPANDQDTATKHYVDGRALLPNKRFLAPYATDSNEYSWTDYQGIPNNFSEREFDELPAGMFACYTGYLPATRLGSLPTNTKGYLIALTYQQPADRNKYYKWIDSTNGNEWEAYFKQGAWNTWVFSSRVLRAGDTMTGDLALTTSASDTTRNLGCQTITNGQLFNLWLGTPKVRLAYTDLFNYLNLVIDGGFQIANAGGILFNIGINPDPLNAATFYVPIDMGTRSIVDVADPVNAQDAATKKYVDNNKVSKSGDTMTGNLSLNIGTDSMRTLGCSDLSESKGFAVLLGSMTNQIQCQLNQPIAIHASDGLVCRQGSTDIIRFGIAAGDLRTDVYQDIIMNQKYIADLHDPDSAQDAATKNYADTLTKKSYSGYIPLLEADISRLGFVASASSFTASFSPFGAFNSLNADGANGSWVTNETTTGFLQIRCPEAVTIWRVALKARYIAARNITAWNFAGSNDGTTFTTLRTSTIPLLGAATAPSFFNISTTTAYRFYRFNITASTGATDVGVQVMQLYVLTTG
jgi:hypothetical protein